MKSDWKSFYATQPEILQYWRDLADKYDLLPHIVFNTAVRDALWDADTEEYLVTLENSSNQVQKVTAQVVLSAIGYLSFPRMPNDIPGIETFSGPSFHSSQWQHDVELKGKRIGVIGLGSSASVVYTLHFYYYGTYTLVCMIGSGQIVPALSDDSSVQVINFWRTPAWMVAPPVRTLIKYLKHITNLTGQAPNTPYSSFDKWLFAHVPFYNKLYRILQMAKVITLLPRELTFCAL